MRERVHALILVAVLVACRSSAAARAAELSVLFSPRGGAAAAICAQVANSKVAIDVAIYSISEPSITAALLAAHKRGVKVRMVVDRAQQNDLYSSAPLLDRGGVEIRTDRREALHHNKYMVIDGLVVVTGSYNFTRSAEMENAENVIIVRDAAVARAFALNWAVHFDHAVPYVVVHHERFPRKSPDLPTLRLRHPEKKKESRSWQESRAL